MERQGMSEITNTPDELDQILGTIYLGDDDDGQRVYLEEIDYAEAKQALLAWREAYATEARVKELKRAKMQGYIAQPFMHKVDRRIPRLSSADSKEVKHES